MEDCVHEFRHLIPPHRLWTRASPPTFAGHHSFPVTLIGSQWGVASLSRLQPPLWVSGDFTQSLHITLQSWGNWEPGAIKTCDYFGV